jgi:hypothetical protein
MRQSKRPNEGRADPLGLLVVAVVLALTATIAIQAQATLGNGSASFTPGSCNIPCVTAEMRR